MDAPLDLRLTVPADAQWAEMVRDVAAQAARHCGRPEEPASAFGRRVEDAVREACLRADIESVAFVIRCADGPVEVVISSERGSRTLTLD